MRQPAHVVHLRHLRVVYLRMSLLISCFLRRMHLGATQGRHINKKQWKHPVKFEQTAVCVHEGEG